MAVVQTIIQTCVVIIIKRKRLSIIVRLNLWRAISPPWRLPPFLTAARGNITLLSFQDVDYIGQGDVVTHAIVCGVRVCFAGKLFQFSKWTI